MSLIKIVRKGGEERLAFRSPALGDVAFEVCTPVQIESIGHALIDRLEPLLLSSNFKIPLAVASLYELLGEDKDQQKDLLTDAYEEFLKESVGWDKMEKEKWKEIIDDEIRAAGFKSAEILNCDFCLSCVETPLICDCIPRLKAYWPPVSAGTALDLEKQRIRVAPFYCSCTLKVPFKGGHHSHSLLSFHVVPASSSLRTVLWVIRLP